MLPKNNRRKKPDRESRTAGGKPHLRAKNQESRTTLEQGYLRAKIKHIIRWVLTLLFGYDIMVL